MIGVAASKGVANGTAFKAIAATGLIAGTLDLTQALVQFGLKTPLAIAGGLIGTEALQTGGPWIYTLGVALHYFIATSWTAIYYLASRKLEFLTQHPLVCGLFYGMAVECFMNLVVLPLSALHAAGPYQLHDLIDGLVTHMFTIGLPIAYGIRYFRK